MKRVRSLSPEFLSIITGILFTLSFPPFDLSFLAWFAWIPLWIGLERSGWRNGFRLGYLSGLIFTLGSLNWIGNNSGTSFLIAASSMIGSVLYLSIYFGLFGYLLGKGGQVYGNRVFLFAPLVWSGIEYIYCWGFMGFPWISLAMTQNLFLPVQQLAEYGGIYIVSTWVLLINSAIYAIEFMDRTGRQQKLYWTGLTVFIVATFAFGGVRIWQTSHTDSPTLGVGVVQNNVEPRDKWVREKKQLNVEKLLSQTDLARLEGAKVVIWPETAVPAYLMYYASLYNKINQFVNQNDISILTGSLHHSRLNNELQTYNAAFFFSPDSEVKLYYKQHLVPFAERLPLVDVFPWLKILNFGQANFTPGTESSIYPLGSRSESANFGAMICYESSDPVLFRQFVLNGVQIMTIITNDGWLGHSLGPYQHLAIARLRSIEHRIPIVRSAQTGISAYIRPNGIIDHRILLNHSGYFVVNVPTKHAETIYTKWGDWFGMLMVLGLIVWTSRTLFLLKKRVAR